MVSLVIVDATGCTDSISLPAVVKCLPTLGFEADTVCQGFPTTFIDTSLGYNGATLQNWVWFFPDGNVFGQNPMHIMDTCGTIRVSLLATDTEGCSNATSRNIYVHCPPTADFQASITCQSSVSFFQDQSVAGDAPITQWLWSFGDLTGGQSTQQNPIYVYDTCGIYTAKLIVTDQNSCADTSSRQAGVWCPPAAVFTADTICQGFSTTFQPSTSQGSTTIQTWSWDFGDGNAITLLSGSMITHAYDTCGIFTATLIITDSSSCADTFSQQIMVRCLPHVDFSADPVCLGDTSLFQDLSTASNGPITQRMWDFGDLSPFNSGINPAHVYAMDGQYSVKLTLTDSAGCQNVDSQLVGVFALPTLNLADTLIILCNQSIPDTLSRYIQSASDPGVWSGPSIITSAWTTYSDSMQGIFDPSILGLNGTYQFVYTITNPAGCINKDTINIRVLNPPIAYAGVDTTFCFGPGIYDLNLYATPSTGTWSSQVPGLTGNSMLNLGLMNPGNNGFYYQIGSGTCVVSDTVIITINPQLLADAGPDSFFCHGDSIQTGGAISAQGGTPPFQYLWSPSGGLSSNSVANPWVKGINGQQVFILEIKDSINCIARDTVIVMENPELRVDAGKNDTICFNETISLQSIGFGGSGQFSFIWSPDTLVTNIYQQNTTTIALTTNHDFVVQITDSLNCVAFDTVSVFVNPQLTALAGLDTLICFQDSFLLSGGSMGGSGMPTYLWSPPLGLNNPNSAITAGGNLNTSQIYTLFVTDSLGCPAVDSVIVEVNPQLFAHAGNDTLICYRDSFQLRGSASLGTPGYTYSWTPATHLNDSTLAQPWVTQLTQDQTFYLKVTDVNGCEAWDTVVVRVNDSLSVIAMAADSLVCYQTGTTLSAQAMGGNGGFTYNWLNLSSGMNVPTGPLAANQVFTVVVTDNNGCTATDSVGVRVSPFFVALAGNDTSLCEGSSLILGEVPNAQGGIAPYSCQWDSAGLPFSAACNPIVSGLQQPTFFHLTVTDSAGCPAMDSVWVIASPPLAADAGRDTLICYGNTARLKGTAIQGISPFIYQWSDAAFVQQPSSNFTASIPLTTSRDFIFQITDSIGCIAVDTVSITVNPAISVSITGDSICDGENIIVQANAGGGSPGYQYNWKPATFLSPANVLTPQLIGLNQTTDYTLIVTDTVLCQDSAIARMTFVPLIQPHFSISYTCAPDSACVGATLTLTDQSVIPAGSPPISRISWDINNDGIIDFMGPSVNFSYGSTGLYTIKQYVWSEAGCLDSSSQQIQVSEPPLAAFSILPKQACAPFAFTLTNQSSGYITTYDWQIFGVNSLGQRVTLYSSNAQNPTNLPQLPQGRLGDTTFYVQLTSGNCCGTHAILDSLTIFPLPIVGFATTVDTGCAPFFVRFFPNQFITVQQTDSIIYDWGDGTQTIVFPNPSGPIRWDITSHTFAGLPFDTTSYVVTLTAFTACGDSSISKRVFVKPNQVRSFFNTAVYNGCEGLRTRVIDYAGGDNIIVSWCFNFDTLNHVCRDSLVTPFRDTVFHTYSTAGDFVIAQFVTDGCSHDTSYFTVHVWPKPHADFQAARFCAGDSTVFTNLSSLNAGANQPPSSLFGYHWSFPPVDSSRQIHPVYAFDSAGTYWVQLVAITNKGCRDTSLKNITILPHPDAAINMANVCLNENSQLFDQTTGANGLIGSWWVQWGDGTDSLFSQAPTFPVSHRYASAGTYPVIWAVTDGQGCRDTSQSTTTIYPLPNPLFSVSQACFGDSTRFMDLSSIRANGGSLYPMAVELWGRNRANAIFRK